jgi:hypothetical protein
MRFDLESTSLNKEEKFISHLNENDLSREESRNRVISFLAEFLECNENERVVREELNENRSSTRGIKLSRIICRIIGSNSANWMETDTEWRTSIVNMIEKNIPEVYQYIESDEGSMGHEKISDISKEVTKVEREFESSTKDFVNLSQIDGQREKLMQSIYSGAGSIIIEPFLPNDFKSTLNNVYDVVKDYESKRESIDELSSKERLDTVLKSAKTKFEKEGTVYSNIISKNLLNSIQKITENKFLNSSITQPADITVDKVEKKYPLYSEDNKINITFRLRNTGQGYSNNTTIEFVSEGHIELYKEKYELGRVAPRSEREVDVHGIVRTPADSCEVLIAVSWVDVSGTGQEESFGRTIDSQRSDVDWEDLQVRHASDSVYSLEAVEDESALVGRRRLFDSLTKEFRRGAEGGSVGSVYITGQKRVGKTSLAKAALSKFEDEGYKCIYLEGGDYVRPDAGRTVEALGRRLCKRIKRSFDPSEVESVSIPDFNNALAPITEFLEDLRYHTGNFDLLLSLDEFDELPKELYKRGDLARSFFLTLRSISSKPNIGVILVGGEKMRHIIDKQGHHINKLDSIQVDYFNNNSDYADLVKNPVSGSLEFTDSAINKTYEITAGNPFFTKLLSRRILDYSIENRDSHITVKEVKKAKHMTIEETDDNVYQHFWKDGIIEEGEEATAKSINRRKLLVAVRDSADQYGVAQKSDILSSQHAETLPEADLLLDEFISRNVLSRVNNTQSVEINVPLFKDWLRGRGVSDIIATINDRRTANEFRDVQRSYKVEREEIKNLTDEWGTYKTSVIDYVKVRDWINQFNSLKERRIAFSLLKEISFIDDKFIRNKISQFGEELSKGLTWKKSGRKKDHICIVSHDEPAKSSSRLSRPFAEENNIYVSNSINMDDIPEKIGPNENVQALVMVDDIIATGETASSAVQEIVSRYSREIKKSNVEKFVFASVVSTESGYKKLDKELDKLNIESQILRGPIVENVIPKVVQRVSKYDIEHDEVDTCIRKYCRRLTERTSSIDTLGFGGLGLGVVFEHGCPNNSLPILWMDQPDWDPLFERH